jgi:tRNA uridine 5-carboxymethylaminomethyl modification enzyme
MMFVGLNTRIAGGRAGDAAAIELAEQLESLGLKVERFKTGTPPRIDGRTVEYSKMEEQTGSMPLYRFAHYEMNERPEQRSCWVTWAGNEVKEIISDHIHESALYGGAIAGRGPRYCPSIEDKIRRFPNAERHQVFLEPEGLNTCELYVNGLSTSLPAEVQLEYLRAVPGLERVKMTRYGYAIEYDYYPPEQLRPSLEVKAVQGLYFAGQVNGTTGYEEAGAQGLLAGVNAVRQVRGEDAMVLEREDAYVGVLVDDLVTRGVDEPYRLFTSRAEYRLLLRQDNALERVGMQACVFGLLTQQESEILRVRLGERRQIEDLARTTMARPVDVNDVLREAGENELPEAQRVSDLVRRPALRLRKLLEATVDELPDVQEDAWTYAEIELKYQGYIERERDTVKKLQGMKEFRLPDEIDYMRLNSICTEARQKLDAIRPESLDRASRIPGVSPSDLQNLLVEALRLRGRKS